MGVGLSLCFLVWFLVHCMNMSLTLASFLLWVLVLSESDRGPLLHWLFVFELSAGLQIEMDALVIVRSHARRPGRGPQDCMRRWRLGWNPALYFHTLAFLLPRWAGSCFRSAQEATS